MMTLGYEIGLAGRLDFWNATLHFDLKDAVTGNPAWGVVVSVYGSTNQLAGRCISHGGSCRVDVTRGYYHATAVSSNYSLTTLDVNPQFTLYPLTISPNFSTVIQPGSLAIAPSFVVFTDGTNFFSKDRTGAVTSSTTFSTILQSDINTFSNSGTAFTPNGGKIELGAGVFSLGSTAITYKSNVTITGAGAQSTVLDGTSLGTGAFAFSPASHTAQMYNVRFEGFKISKAPNGINLKDVWNPRLTDLEVADCNSNANPGTGLQLDGGQFGTSGLLALNVFVRNCVNNIVFGVSNAAGFLSLNKFIGGGATGATQSGVALAVDLGSGAGVGIATTSFMNFQIEANQWGARIGNTVGVSDTTFINCFFDTNSANDIMNFAQATRTSVIGGLYTSSKMYSAAPGQLRVTTTSINPIGRIISPFVSGMVSPFTGPAGPTANPGNNTVYTVTGVDIFILSSGGTAVVWVIKDPSGNTMVQPGGASTLTDVHVPVGWTMVVTYNSVPTTTIVGA